MKAHITAILAALSPTIDAYYVDVPDGATYPYVLLWGSPGGAGVESSIAADSDMSDLLGVTVVDIEPTNVLSAVQTVRGILNGLRPAVTGRQVLLTFEYSSTVQPDKTVKLPETGSFPFYAVDRYRLIDTPAD